MVEAFDELMIAEVRLFGYVYSWELGVEFASSIVPIV